MKGGTNVFVVMCLLFLLLPVFSIFFLGFVAVFLFPPLCGLLLIIIVKIIRWTLGIEKVPVLWMIYTGVCALRGTIILFPEIFMDKTLGGELNLLLREYAIVTLITLLLWIIIEKIYKPIMGKSGKIKEKF